MSTDEFEAGAYFQKLARAARRRRVIGGFHWNGPKVQRNAPCPCGSGLKAKRCCLDRGVALNQKNQIAGQPHAKQ